MISYRRDTSGLINYNIYCADSLINQIDWTSISTYVNRAIVKVLKGSDTNSSLYGSETRTYTEEESIALCSLPLKDLESGEYFHLDTDDLQEPNAAKYITTIDKLNITMEEFRSGTYSFSFIIRVFHIDSHYALPAPGYRIQPGTWRGEKRNAFVLSIFMDSRCPERQEDLVRFTGELSEAIIQYRLKQCSIQNMYYDSPDYNVHDNGVSIYKSTATIVIKDFPTINDLLFGYKYVDTIFDGILSAFSLLGIKCDLMDDELINAYFGVDYGDDNKWFLETEDFEKILKSKSEDIYKLVLDKVNKIYLN